MSAKTDNPNGPCGVDSTPVRQMFPVSNKSGGKNSKRQHARWKVCEKGHQLYRKAG